MQEIFIVTVLLQSIATKLFAFYCGSQLLIVSLPNLAFIISLVKHWLSLPIQAVIYTPYFRHCLGKNLTQLDTIKLIAESLQIHTSTTLYFITVPDNCSIPKKINSLIFTKHIGQILEGSNITLACPPGMVLKGPSTSSCLGSGEWEPDPRDSKCTGYYQQQSCVFMQLIPLLFHDMSVGVHTSYNNYSYNINMLLCCNTCWSFQCHETQTLQVFQTQEAHFKD